MARIGGDKFRQAKMRERRGEPGKAQENPQVEEDAAVDQIIDFFNALHAEHGLLSEEFQDF